MELSGRVLRCFSAGCGLEALKSQQHVMIPKSVSCAKCLLIFHTSYSCQQQKLGSIKFKQKMPDVIFHVLSVF